MMVEDIFPGALSQRQLLLSWTPIRLWLLVEPSHVDNGGGYACVGHGVRAKSLYLSLNFTVNLKLL